jgi:hypothetical protein
MRFQYDFVGGPTTQNLGLEVCPRCEDEAAYQQKMLVLPPDPQPFKNLRPYPYEVDQSFSPIQQLATTMILNLNLFATMEATTNLGTPGAWLFDEVVQSGELLTAGVT